MAGVGNQRLQPAHEPVVRHDVPISLTPEASRVKPMNSKAVSLTHTIDVIKMDGPNVALPRLTGMVFVHPSIVTLVSTVTHDIWFVLD